MRIEVLDGKIFEGNNIKDIVRNMKRLDFSCPSSIKNYMILVKDRVKLSTGKDITTKNVTGFVTDLQKLGLIRIIEEECENE